MFKVGQYVQVLNQYDDPRAIGGYYKAGRITGVNRLLGWIVQFHDGSQEHVDRNIALYVMEHDYVLPLPEGYKMQRLLMAR
jgi:hypothetical protein